MTFSRTLPLLAAVPALILASCSSTDEPSPTESSPTSAASMPTGSCPTAPPADDTAAEWTFSGTSGSIAVAGSTDTATPKVTVDGPFSVDATVVQTLKAGDGAVVSPTATVSVCYKGVNGRNGNVFDETPYKTGSPVEFPLNGVVAGFSKAIAGQKVGSTVAVAMIPADGYPAGQPAAGIEPGDTLIFAIKILSATG